MLFSEGFPFHRRAAPSQDYEPGHPVFEGQKMESLDVLSAELSWQSRDSHLLQFASWLLGLRVFLEALSGGICLLFPPEHLFCCV